MTDIEFVDRARGRLSRSSSPVNSEGCVEWTGALLKSGYGQVNFEGKHWRVHRLAYLVEHGSLTPGMVINHTCGNAKCLNAADHLEEVTQGQNVQYRSVMASNNTSGYRNVFWDSGKGKWLVAVGIGGKQYSFGRFEHKSDAVLAAGAAREKLGLHMNGGVSEW